MGTSIKKSVGIRVICTVIMIMLFSGITTFNILRIEGTQNDNVIAVTPKTIFVCQSFFETFPQLVIIIPRFQFFCAFKVCHLLHIIPFSPAIISAGRRSPADALLGVSA